MKNVNLPPNIQELSKKGEEIYNFLADKLKIDNDGKYIAIVTESKDYFIGETKDEAVSKAEKKYPEKLVFVRRIGNIEKVSSFSSSQFFGDYNYACIF